MTLPEEVLSQICWSLGPGRGGKIGSFWVSERETLFRLMCTSKAFYRAARPVLYHTLMVGDDMASISLEHLLHICTKHPDTVSLVKELYLGSWDLEDILVHSSLPQVESCLAAIETVNISHGLRADIEEGVRKGWSDAMIALLLCICRKIEVLHAQPIALEDSLLFRLVENHEFQAIAMRRNNRPAGVTEMSPMRSLKCFHIQIEDAYSVLSVREILGILRIPSLESLTTTRTMFVSPIAAGLKSTLRYIDLSNSIIDSAGFDYLLSGCPDLCEVDVQLGDASVGSCRVDFREIGDILRQRGSRIQCFGLDTTRTPEKSPRGHVLGDLRGMHMLRILHATWDALFQPMTLRDGASCDTPSNYLADTLPGSLEKLQIIQTPTTPGYMEELDVQLLGIMKSDGLRKLVSIVVGRAVPFSFQLPIHVDRDGGFPAGVWDRVEGEAQGWMCFERNVQSSATR